jgi:hypothetical protein
MGLKFSLARNGMCYCGFRSQDLAAVSPEKGAGLQAAVALPDETINLEDPDAFEARPLLIHQCESRRFPMRQTAKTSL